MMCFFNIVRLRIKTKKQNINLIAFTPIYFKSLKKLLRKGTKRREELIWKEKSRLKWTEGTKTRAQSLAQRVAGLQVSLNVDGSGRHSMNVIGRIVVEVGATSSTRGLITRWLALLDGWIADFHVTVQVYLIAQINCIETKRNLPLNQEDQSTWMSWFWILKSDSLRSK